MRTITPEELHAICLREGTVNLLDVRTPVEFRALHARYARNVPLDSFDPDEVIAACDPASEQLIYVICQGGGRGAKACEKLLAAGCSRAINVAGGTAAWERAGLPVVRGKATISLERQVRIAAGLLVLVGLAFGYFLHPYWFGLAAFVGAGLTFAGVTDTCGLGMLLARMPWNRVSTCCASGSACGKE